MSILIGADIGTSNIKVIAFKNNSEVLLSEKTACPTLCSSPDSMEQDPDMMLQLVNALLKKILLKLNGETVAGICFSTAMHSIMAIDKNHKPLTNAILWGDTRSAHQCEQLKAAGDHRRLYPQTGVPLHPSLPLCKIIWMRENMPEIFNKAEKFISLKEYFFYQWFGQYIIDHSIAGATGMLDLHSLQWSKAALQAAGISEHHLSRIVPVTHIESRLTEPYQRYFSIKNLPFVVGSSDGCLANTGSGVSAPDEAAITIGTSGAVRTTIASPELNDPVLFCYPLLKDVYIQGGAVNNGGNVLAWFVRNFMNQSTPSVTEYDTVLNLAQTAAPGAEGLLFLPYLQGERAPVWDAAARGVFFGINTMHRQPHFARALLEGICFGLYDVFCALNQQHNRITTLYASGGFVQNNFWVQMVADLFNKTVIINDEADASATGAALLGGYATGISASFSNSSPQLNDKQKFYPNQEKHHIYMRYFPIFRSLYPALEQAFSKLQPL